MKKVILTLLCFIIIGGALQAQTSSTASSQKNVSDVVKFEETVHHFGKIPYGKPVEFDVVMRNISNDSVRISNVQVGCGCTTPKWTAGPYAPNETFKVRLGFNGYADGHFEKYVTIFFDGGYYQQIKFDGETYKTPADVAPANDSVKQLQSSVQ